MAPPLRRIGLVTAFFIVLLPVAAGQLVTIQQDRIDLNGGNISNFFASSCSGNSVVDAINEDGTYSCTTNIPIPDTWVNESGDTMTGNLSMANNYITNLADPTASSDAMTKGFADATYLNRGGDTMAGNLDLAGFDILNVNSIGNGSSPIGVTSTLALNGNNVQNPGSISSYFATACNSGEAVQDIGDDGTFTCVTVGSGGAANDVYVNESGDTMSGNLDMGGSGWVQNADLVHGSRLGVATDSTTADSQTTGGFNVYVQDNLTVDGDIIGSGSDLAERMPKHDPAEQISPGDVVGIVNGAITRDTSESSLHLVVSTAPGLTLRDAYNLGKLPVAFTGRVPVKVTGAAAPGDYLIPSGANDGTAVAVSPGDITFPEYRAAVGVVLSRFNASQATDDRYHALAEEAAETDYQLYTAVVGVK